MKVAIVLFFVGLTLFLTGIYVSTISEIPGMLMGIFGGTVMGISTYFFVYGRKNEQ